MNERVYTLVWYRDAQFGLNDNKNFCPKFTVNNILINERKPSRRNYRRNVIFWFLFFLFYYLFIYYHRDIRWQTCMYNYYVKNI